MKVGRKTNKIEAEKIRPCIVRLQKVLPTLKAKNSISKQQLKTLTTTKDLKDLSTASEYREMNEKMFKGPLKKRPITDSNKTAPLTPNSGTKGKLKATLKREVESPPPTIAASRSRRSIKPNPKYANEDIVTPKTIRATTNVPSTGKKGSFNISYNKQKEAQYDSSSEDFFNKDTSEESGLDGEDDVKILDKPYEILDSDETDVELKNEIPIKKPRGRPKKNAIPISTTQLDVVGTSPSVKTTSQMQIIRRNLNNQVTKTPINNTVTAVKRKLDNTDNNDSITRKRILLAPGGVRILKDSQSPDNTADNSHRTLPVATPTSNRKLVTDSVAPTSATQIQTAQEQRRTLMAKTLARTSSNISPKGSSTPGQKTSPNVPQHQNPKPIAPTQKSAASRVMAMAKRRSASPLTIKQTKEPKKVISNNVTEEDDPVAASPNSPSDDFESMPTFTIVNINDIINKKGDALISRSSPPPSKPTSAGTVQSTEDTTDDNNDASTIKLPTLATGKQIRRRGPQSKILAEKQQAGKHQNGTRNTTQNAEKISSSPTILNHTLESFAMKQARQARSAAHTKTQKSPEKPAPRILNSMVAKKTDPVKPVIANLDDSADESFPLSMDENESEDDDIMNDKSYDSSTDIDRVSSKSKTTKSTVPAAKENSSAITNCITNSSSNNNNNNNSKFSMVNSTPEKVVIQRQGDKIIKKVTCFENWYVLNIPDDKPPEPVRNQLEIPLIKLANLTEDVVLPTSSWTAKVTLYELSASTLASSTLITYTGDLSDHNIAEEDRAKYQPSCVMFRRSVAERTRVRLPYDRAVIFKNKTFFTNIEGKNVKLVGAPNIISSQEEVEILLQIVNDLTLDSTFVEPATTTQ